MRVPGIAILLTVAAASPAAAQSDDLYKRAGARLAADPALAEKLGHPAPEMREVAYMVGIWDVTADVAAVPGRPPEHGTSVITPLFGGVWLEIRDSYASGTQDVTYLAYDPGAAQWTSVSIDSLADANIAHARAWTGDTLVFETDATVIGMPARLRQTITRDGPDAYGIRNEEWRDGGWHLLDSYRYRRRGTP